MKKEGIYNEFIYDSFDYNDFFEEPYEIGNYKEIGNYEIGNFNCKKHGFGPASDIEKSGVQNSLNLNKIYFLILEYVSNKLDKNFDKTYKTYVRFLRKCILPQIKKEIESLDCEFVELDLYYESVLKRYQQVFMELLRNLKEDKHNEVVLIEISLVLTAYNNYMEDKKVYEQAKNEKRENKNVEYNFDTLDVLKDFMKQKLTLG